MKNISVLVPVYNEEERLNIVFEALLKTWPKNVSLKEVIFVDDGSTDKTKKLIVSIAKSLKNKLGADIKLVSFASNRGKGYAVKAGMQKARGDYLLLIDVDMSTPFAELKKFTEYVNRGDEVIVGTRKNGHSTVVVAQPIYRQIMGKAFTYIAQLALGVKVSDFTCGFKLFSKSAYQSVAPLMSIDRWGYDAELLYISAGLGLTISEVPVAWYNDDRTKVSLLKDVVRSLADLWMIRLNGWRGRYAQSMVRDTLKEGVISWAKEI